MVSLPTLVAGLVFLVTDGGTERVVSNGVVGATFGLHLGGVYTDFVRSERVWQVRDVDP